MNSWRITEALVSFRRLKDVIHEMTEEEIVRAIALEEESLRRKSILDRLYRQSRVLARATHEATLKKAITQEK